MGDYNDEQAEIKPLFLDESARSFILETCKWARLLSILGFIGIGLMLIGALLFGTLMSSLNLPGSTSAEKGVMFLSGGFIAIIYLIIAAVYTFPVLYLYRFATNTKTALISEDQDALNYGLENLKKHYKFVGITVLIFIIFYGIAFMLTLLAGTAFF